MRVSYPDVGEAAAQAQRDRERRDLLELRARWARGAAEAHAFPGASVDSALAYLVRVGVVLACTAAVTQTALYLTNVFLLDTRFEHLNADVDGNALAWASSTATLVAAFAASLGAVSDVRRRMRSLALAFVLAYFALDDMFALHEKATVRIHETLLGGDPAVSRLFWPVLFLPLLGYAFIALLQAASGAKRCVRVALHGALALLALAVLAELLSSTFPPLSPTPTVAYALEVSFEEAAELAAWVIIAFALAAKALHDVRNVHPLQLVDGLPTPQTFRATSPHL